MWIWSLYGLLILVMYHADEMLLPYKAEGIYNWHYGMLVILWIQEKLSLFKTFIKN